MVLFGFVGDNSCFGYFKNGNLFGIWTNCFGYKQIGLENMEIWFDIPNGYIYLIYFKMVLR